VRKGRLPRTKKTVTDALVNERVNYDKLMKVWYKINTIKYYFVHGGAI